MWPEITISVVGDPEPKPQSPQRSRSYPAATQPPPGFMHSPETKLSDHSTRALLHHGGQATVTVSATVTPLFRNCPSFIFCPCTSKHLEVGHTNNLSLGENVTSNYSSQAGVSNP